MSKAQLAAAAGFAMLAGALAAMPAAFDWDNLIPGILALVGIALLGIGVLCAGLLAFSLAVRLRSAARSARPARLAPVRNRRAYS
jgi:hypothetical protein